MTMTSQAVPTPSLSMSLFGITGPEVGDRSPTSVKSNFRKVVELTVKTSFREVRPVVVPSLGHSISYQTEPKHAAPPDDDDLPEIEDEVGDFIEVDIPAEDDYYERFAGGPVEPERRHDIVGENEFQIPEALVETIEAETLSREEVLRNVLLEQASLLYAYDDASNFVEAAMRDGLGMEVEMDRDNLPEAFVPLSRLSVLASYIEQSTMPDRVKQTLLARLTVKTADEMILAMNKKKVPEAVAALHKHYAATVTKSGVQPDVEVPMNTVGVRTSRK